MDRENQSEPAHKGTADLVPVVGIGASAGGLGALRAFFEGVPEDSGLAYVVVIHLSPEYESHLDDLLQPHVQMPVQQVTQTTALQANHVYVIPPGANLSTIDMHLRLSELEAERRKRAPIDRFFRTLAETHRENAIGVILTGTGSDGTVGMKRIKELGGLTVVQDPDEAEYDGMPRSAIGTGLMDLVVSIREMPEHIRKFAQIRPRVPVPEDDELDEQEPAPERRERELEAELQSTNEERYRLLVESAREYAIFLIDTDGRISTWNAGAERIFGYAEEEIIGRSADALFTEEDRAADVPEAELETARREGQANNDRWQVRKDDSRFWASGMTQSLRFPEGALRGFVKVLRDNTERKENEERLRQLNETLEERVEERMQQVREMAAQLAVAEQRERRRIAQILHDDLQQRLYGLGMRASFIRQDVTAGDTESALENIDGLEQWIDEAVQTARSLTVDLSPPVLEGEGLLDALGWLRSQVRERHALEVHLEHDPAFEVPERDLRELLFQEVRELLLNVVKHAGVDEARVALHVDDDYLRLEVCDEGRGFVPEEIDELQDQGFGLSNIRERLDLFDGEMTIDAAPGEGTRVTLRLPRREA